MLWRVVTCAAVMFFMPGVPGAQECHYVHPPEPPKASAFPQPPSDGKIKFVGPIIRQVSVTCWYAEPDAPTKCVGGVHGFQRVQVFLPTDAAAKPEAIDTSFHQQSPLPFSAGGATSEMKSDDLPGGIFVSFKGHPIFKVVKVQFPSKGLDPPFTFNGPSKTGALVDIDFSHEPTNGECYLYAAVWIAVK